MPHPRRVTIEVTDSETAIERGTHKTIWYVQRGEDWVHPRDLGEVEREQLPRAKGVVWAERFQLSVQVGSRVMRVDTRPSRAPLKSALAYMEREVRRARQVTHRRYYRVSQNGTFEPER